MFLLLCRFGAAAPPQCNGYFRYYDLLFSHAGLWSPW